MKDILLIEGNAQDAEIALECLKVNGPANRTHAVGDGPEAGFSSLSESSRKVRRGSADSHSA
jgi:hypothetical protein